jgi:hypothetical protein
MHACTCATVLQSRLVLIFSDRAKSVCSSLHALIRNRPLPFLDAVYPWQRYLHVGTNLVTGAFALCTYPNDLVTYLLSSPVLVLLVTEPTHTSPPLPGWRRRCTSFFACDSIVVILLTMFPFHSLFLLCLCSVVQIWCSTTILVRKSMH